MFSRAESLARSFQSFGASSILEQSITHALSFLIAVKLVKSKCGMQNKRKSFPPPLRRLRKSSVSSVSEGVNLVHASDVSSTSVI